MCEKQNASGICLAVGLESHLNIRLKRKLKSLETLRFDNQDYALKPAPWSVLVSLTPGVSVVGLATASPQSLRDLDLL